MFLVIDRELPGRLSPSNPTPKFRFNPELDLDPIPIPQPAAEPLTEVGISLALLLFSFPLKLLSPIQSSPMGGTSGNAIV
jgi:hypothetical protein